MWILVLGAVLLVIGLYPKLLIEVANAAWFHVEYNSNRPQDVPCLQKRICSAEAKPALGLTAIFAVL